MQKKVEWKETEKAERFLFDMFELDEEEFAAAWGMEEMAQELFNLCLAKNITRNYIGVYDELWRKYSELCSNYEKQLIRAAEETMCPEKAQEEKKPIGRTCIRGYVKNMVKMQYDFLSVVCVFNKKR